MLDFIENAESPFLVSLIQRTWPLIAAFYRHRIRLCIETDALDVFRMLKHKRVIICANHPAQEDGLILFAISGIVAERFAYLTARDVFGKAGSLQAIWLQKLGCYSVQRGTADIRAFKHSCQILQSGEHKLVIFPEGEINHKNGSLKQFESGTELIAISTLHKLKLSGSSEQVFVLPLALKYKYSRNITHHLLTIMKLLESRLEMKPAGIGPLEIRIKRAYEQLIGGHIQPASSNQCMKYPFDEKMSAFCETRIANYEELLGIENTAKMGQIRRIHLLMNSLVELFCGKDKAQTAGFSKKLIRTYYDDLRRLIGLMSVGEHSFDHDLPQEEAAELLRLLAEEILVGFAVKKPDIVLIGAAAPINVEEFLPAGRSDRKNCVVNLKRELERRISLRLASLESPMTNATAACLQNVSAK